MSSKVSLLSFLRSSVQYHQKLRGIETYQTKFFLQSYSEMRFPQLHFDCFMHRWHAIANSSIFHPLLCHLRSLISLLLLPHEFVGNRMTNQLRCQQHHFYLILPLLFNHLPINQYLFCSLLFSTKADSLKSSVVDFLSTALSFSAVDFLVTFCDGESKFDGLAPSSLNDSVSRWSSIILGEITSIVLSILSTSTFILPIFDDLQSFLYRVAEIWEIWTFWWGGQFYHCLSRPAVSSLSPSFVLISKLFQLSNRETWLVLSQTGGDIRSNKLSLSSLLSTLADLLTIIGLSNGSIISLVLSLWTGTQIGGGYIVNISIRKAVFHLLLNLMDGLNSWLLSRL